MKIKCPHCDANRDDGLGRCPACGLTLEEADASAAARPQRRQALSTTSGLLAVLAALAGALCILAGLASLSQATMGVGFIGIGCFAGIVARMLQATYYAQRS